MGGSRIDRDRLCTMSAAGTPTQEIAAEFGVQTPAVCRAAAAMGLPSRKQVGPLGAYARKTSPTPDRQRVVAPIERAPGMTELQFDALRTKGKWAELAAVADKHGVTHRQAVQVWHQVRAA